MSRGFQRSKIDRVPKHTKKRLKQFITKVGYGHLIPRLLKCHGLWYDMDKTFIYTDIFPEDPRTPSFIIDEIRKKYEMYATSKEITLQPSETTITISEGFGIYYSLACSVSFMFKPESKIYQQMKPFLDEHNDDDNFNLICRESHFGILWAAIHTSSIEGYIFGLDFSSDYPSDNKNCELLRLKYKLLQVKPQKHKVNLADRHRIGYELIFCKNLKDFHHQSTTYKEKAYKLYIQSHALKRVAERLNLKKNKTPYTILDMYTLFNEPIHYKHNLLIPVVYSQKNKEVIGYFVGHCNESECILVTFLFVTQTGTPEGDRISETFSLDKRGQNYLEIVTFDQMVRSDIKEDEYLRGLFCQCGLEHLFAIDEDMLEEYSNSASFIRKTLMMDEFDSMERPVAM